MPELLQRPPALIRNTSGIDGTLNWLLQNGSPDLSIIAPGALRESLGQVVMSQQGASPGKGPAAAGWVSRELKPTGSGSQRLSFWLWKLLAACFQTPTVKESVTKANGKLGGYQFPCNRGILPFFGDVAQC